VGKLNKKTLDFADELTAKLTKRGGTGGNTANNNTNAANNDNDLL
jgi:hypothetical protein